MKSEKTFAGTSWNGTGVYIPFSKEYSSTSCSSESKEYLPEESSESEKTFAHCPEVERVYIPYSPSREKRNSSEEDSSHSYVEEISLDKDLEEICARIEDAGERYIRKIRRAQRTYTRMAIEEIFAAKEDALEEIKNNTLDVQGVYKEGNSDEEEVDKLREEVERLKKSVNMLGQVLFRNSEGAQSSS